MQDHALNAAIALRATLHLDSLQRQRQTRHSAGSHREHSAVLDTPVDVLAAAFEELVLDDDGGELPTLRLLTHLLEFFETHGSTDHMTATMLLIARGLGSRGAHAPISLSPTNWRLLLFAAYVLVSKYLEDGKPVRFGQMQMLWIAFDLQHGEPSSSSSDDEASGSSPAAGRARGRSVRWQAPFTLEQFSAAEAALLELLGWSAFVDTPSLERHRSCLAERAAQALAELGGAMLKGDERTFLDARQAASSSSSGGGGGSGGPAAAVKEEARDEATAAAMVADAGRGGGWDSPPFRRASARKPVRRGREPLRTVQEVTADAVEAGVLLVAST